jgi:hypothetical protein
MVTWQLINEERESKKLEIISWGGNDVLTQFKNARTRKNNVGEKRPLSKTVVQILCVVPLPWLHTCRLDVDHLRGKFGRQAPAGELRLPRPGHHAPCRQASVAASPAAAPWPSCPGYYAPTQPLAATPRRNTQATVPPAAAPPPPRPGHHASASAPLGAGGDEVEWLACARAAAPCSGFQVWTGEKNWREHIKKRSWWRKRTEDPSSIQRNVTQDWLICCLKVARKFCIVKRSFLVGHPML